MKERLIVVCARTLLDHIPAEADQYEQAKLWKALRELCTLEAGTADVNGHTARLLMPSAERIVACSRTPPTPERPDGLLAAQSV